MEEYLCRESPAAQYVLRNLPTAKSEAEFRSKVKLAAEMEMDPDVGNGVGARLGLELADPALAKAEDDREAEFQHRLAALLGQERTAEMETQRQVEAEREQSDQQQRREQQERLRIAAMAEGVGVDAAAAGRFLDRLKEVQPTMNARFTDLEKTLTGTPEEKHRQMQAAVQAELEKLAVETLGEKGRDLARKLAEE
jgi:hypothetical protein